MRRGRTIKGIIRSIYDKIISIKYEILIFFSVSLAVINWFDGWNYIHQIDGLFSLNPERMLYEVVMYSWRDSISLGTVGFGFNLIPFYFFQTLLLKFFSIFLDYWQALVISQFIMYYLTVFTAFAFSWLFFREIGKVLLGLNVEKNEVKIALIVVSFFYVVNPITMSMSFGRYMSWAPFLAATPLLCYFYLRYLCTSNFKFILLSALTFLTPLGAGFSQVGFFNLFFMYFLITTLVYVKQKNYTIKALALKALTFIAVFTLLIFWAFTPQIIGSKYTALNAKPRAYTPTVEILQYASKFTTIANIYRFIGYWVLHSTYMDSYPFAWAESYLNNNLVTSLLFIHPILFALSIVLYSEEKDKTLKKLFLILVAFFILFPIVMKGTADPFSEIGIYLLKIHEIFFRHPHDRFIYSFILIYSLILLFLFRRMYMLLKSKHFYAILLLIFILFSFLGYPFFTGNIVHPTDKIDLSSTDYLRLEKQLGKNLSDLTSYRLLVVPYSPTATYSYNISGKVNRVALKSLVWAFVPHSTVIQFAHFSPADRVFIDYLSRYIEANDYSAFLNLLKIVSIKYIVLHKDFSLKYENFPYYIRIAPLTIKFVKNLEKEGLITKIFENRDIIIYEINEEPNKIVEAMPQMIIVGDSGETFYVKSGKTVNENIYVPKSGRYTLVIYGKGYFEARIANQRFKFSSIDFSYKYFGPLFLSKGMYNLTITTPIIVLKEYSFKDLREWDIKEAISKGYVLNITREGPNEEHVLKVVTSRNKRDWSWILGEPIDVNPGNAYLIVTHMRYENVKQSHISILGFDNVTKKWSKSLQLVQVPPGQDGTSDWKEYKAVIVIPENITKIRPALNAGWVLDPSKGNATTWFGNITIYLLSRAYILNIWLYSTKTNRTIDQLFEAKEEYAEIIDYQKINPTLWKVRVNATRPFMLSFAMTYDPLWEARVYKNGKEVGIVEPIPLYSIINSFWVNETGELEIVIRYKPQDWFKIGLRVSLATHVGCIVYLFYDWRREKGDTWVLEIERRLKRFFKRRRFRVSK